MARDSSVMPTDSTAVSTGSHLTIIGNTQRTAEGNVQLVSCLAAGTALGRTPDPLHINGRDVGGLPFGYQAGVAGAASLNNLGIFVRVSGLVTSVDGRNWRYWIDDGSALSQTPGRSGLMVIAYGPPLPTQGTRVTVVGFAQITSPDGAPALYEAPH